MAIAGASTSGPRQVITKVALLAACLAGPAAAQEAEAPCALQDAEPIPVLEQAKAAFMAGNYTAFYRAATPYVPDARARYDDLMGDLARLFPDGFPSCATVLQRRDKGGMVQELTLYEMAAPNSGLLSIMLTAVPLQGEYKIVAFVFNSKVGEVLDELR